MDQHAYFPLGYSAGMTNAFVTKMLEYSSLNQEEVGLLVGAVDAPRKVLAHRDLIREGDKPGPVFVVLEGWVCRYKLLPDGSRQIVAFMMPGDFCDLHMGTLEKMDHSVGTISECRIASISREKMEKLILATPGLTRAFWRAQLIDQGVMRAWIVSIGRRSAAARVAHLVLELYLRMRSVGLASDDFCRMPLTQTTFADALGLTPVHINRVIRSLREGGLMKLERGKLTILKPAKLAVEAGFDENYLHRRLRHAA